MDFVCLFCFSLQKPKIFGLKSKKNFQETLENLAPSFHSLWTWGGTHLALYGLKLATKGFDEVVRIATWKKRWPGWGWFACSPNWATPRRFLNLCQSFLLRGCFGRGTTKIEGEVVLKFLLVMGLMALASIIEQYFFDEDYELDWEDAGVIALGTVTAGAIILIGGYERGEYHCMYGSGGGNEYKQGPVADAAGDACQC